MDIRINLLPPELQFQLAQKKKKRDAAFLFAALFLLLSTALGLLMVANYQIQKDIQSMQAEKNKIQQKFSLYKPYQEMQANREKVQALLPKAMGNPPDYYTILEGIGIYIPGDIQLTSLEVGTLNKDKTNESPQNEAMQKAADLANKLEKNINQKESKPQVINGELVLQGFAAEAVAVADWLEEIRQIPGITDIHCQSITEEYDLGQPLTRFEIRASLLQPATGEITATKAGE